MTPRPVTGEHEAQNGACLQRFADIERRLERLEDESWKASVTDALSDLRSQVSHLKGLLAGYVVVGGVLGGVLSFIASYVFRGH